MAPSPVPEQEISLMIAETWISSGSRMFAMPEESALEIPEWHTIGPDNYDHQEFIANLEEQLLLQGDVETAEALMEQFANEPNLYEEE